MALKWVEPLAVAVGGVVLSTTGWGADDPSARALQQQQLQRQQQQQQQFIEPGIAQPSGDQGTRRAKAERERQKAQQESQRQLQRVDAEQQKNK